MYLIFHSSYLLFLQLLCLSGHVFNTVIYFTSLVLSPFVYLVYCLTYKTSISFQGASSFKNSHFLASCEKLTLISKSFIHKAHDTIVKCFLQMQPQQPKSKTLLWLSLLKQFIDDLSYALLSPGMCTKNGSKATHFPEMVMKCSQNRDNYFN